MLKSGVYISISLFLITKIIYSEASCSCDEPDLDFSEGVNLIYYKCNNETPGTIVFPISKPEDILKSIEDKRIIIYIFGYLQIPEEPNVQIVMNALCYGRTDNVVLLDWSRYSRGGYISVFRNAEKVGILLARTIKLFVEEGFDVSKLYIIGHSLGAHIAGFAGKCNDFIIPRITGLDPANPFIYPNGCYLTANDAKMVDVIHTDRGKYGTPIDMGTADYDANFGVRPQPGCAMFGPFLSLQDVCSHQRSVKIFVESKYEPDKFSAVQCSSVIFYVLNYCSALRTRVGYAATDISGKFYFRT